MSHSIPSTVQEERKTFKVPSAQVRLARAEEPRTVAAEFMQDTAKGGKFSNWHVPEHKMQSSMSRRVAARSEKESIRE